MSKALNKQPSNRHQVIKVINAPSEVVWQNLLSGNRERIAAASAAVHEDGLTDEYASYLILARRRNSRRERRLFRFIAFKTAYSERERRSALSALGLLWGGLGREVAVALDPKASHFDRERAHRALRQLRGQPAVQPPLRPL